MIRRQHTANAFSTASSAKEEWPAKADVIVVGFGCAGACAALEAARGGANVVILERFAAGGCSTARSGGVLYFGGGTEIQSAAGVEDSEENMMAYLKAQCCGSGAVSLETVRDFCTRSKENLRFLQNIGVSFRNSRGEVQLYGKKTYYPPSYATLYTSGNEGASPYNTQARPASRGHRVFGEGLTGGVLFEKLRAAVESHPRIHVREHCKVSELISSDDGRVEGVICSEILPWGALRDFHTQVAEATSNAALFSRCALTLATYQFPPTSE